MLLNKFKNQVEQTLRLAEKEKNEKPGAESQSHHYHDRYQTLATNILKHLIEPRMEIVADVFDDASLDVNADVGYARLSFLHQEFSAMIYLLFCLRLDYSAQMVRLYAESCLRPYALDYGSSASLVIALNNPNLKRGEAFVEDQILKFVKGYLRAKPKKKDGVMNHCERGEKNEVCCS